MFRYSTIDSQQPRRQDVGMALNIRIREIRKSRKMTLAQLAGQVSTSIPHMSEVERGLKNLNNHLLERISAALGVAPSDLISSDVDTDIARLNELVSRLDAADAARVAAFAEALVKSKEEAGQT